MILSKMVHPPKQMKRCCRKAARRQGKLDVRSAISMLHLDAQNSIEDIWIDEAEHYVDYLIRLEEEEDERIMDEIHKQELAEDDYRFQHRLDEYSGWSDEYYDY